MRNVYALFVLAVLLSFAGVVFGAYVVTVAGP